MSKLHDPNIIGKRGELCFELAITDYKSFPHPLFRPGFLGDKWPTLDYYIELQGPRKTTPFFFVQVKSTVAKLTPGATLRVQVKKSHLARLLRLPAPTYLVAVHEPSKRVFILSLSLMQAKTSYSIPQTHELTSENLRKLYQEVSNYWRTGPQHNMRSSFT